MFYDTLLEAPIFIKNDEMSQKANDYLQKNQDLQ